MNRKAELMLEIAELELRLEPLKKELNELYVQEQESVSDKVDRCLMAKDKFTPEELRYAAFNRCLCGAGMAYPKNIGFHGKWICSAILLGEASPGVAHTPPLPFAFYEIKPENQPSANGATTRP